MSRNRILGVVVGFFFCLGIAAIFILTLRVSGVGGGVSGPTYTVHAGFNNIGGLKTGATVSMDGVRIGQVTDISLNQTTFKAIVTIKISNTYDKIPKDSSASILTHGLLGEQYIGVEPGGSRQALADGDKIKFTQSALILEKLLGQVLVNKSGGSGK
jgi:phospholipid/cholesterol/gamma-HCH transport system substrate-binding protein